jgi:hypothetical protein
MVNNEFKNDRFFQKETKNAPEGAKRPPMAFLPEFVQCNTPADGG